MEMRMMKRYSKRLLTYIYLLMKSISLAFTMQQLSYSTDKIPIPINKLPDDLNKVMNKSIYKKALWGLRVVDLDTGNVLLNLNSSTQFYIGSVRKIFSVG
ncbi:TPA: peptidase S13, partial [Legionella pneumophila subsp. pneumophila]|nr:peptidase S13 [Legionella pneumophila subsp. pneumophila]